jgi:hypothetical protein
MVSLRQSTRQPAARNAAPSQRKPYHRADPVLRVGGLGKQFQVLDALTYRDLSLAFSARSVTIPARNGLLST